MDRELTHKKKIEVVRDGREPLLFFSNAWASLYKRRLLLSVYTVFRKGVVYDSFLPFHIYILAPRHSCTYTLNIYYVQNMYTHIYVVVDGIIIESDTLSQRNCVSFHQIVVLCCYVSLLFYRIYTTLCLTDIKLITMWTNWTYIIKRPIK